MIAPLDEKQVSYIDKKLHFKKYDQRLYRLINIAINISMCDSILVSDEKSKIITRNFLKNIKKISAAFYGIMAPLVLSSWGVENDNDIFLITKTMFEFLFFVPQNLKNSLLRTEEYRGTEITTPVTNIDECDEFNWLIETYLKIAKEGLK
jgi:uncharacterized repeat protein (TIGR04138 family)